MLNQGREKSNQVLDASEIQKSETYKGTLIFITGRVNLLPYVELTAIRYWAQDSLAVRQVYQWQKYWTIQ